MYAFAMAGRGNILITDESALHVLMHGDWADRIERFVTRVDPLDDCAATLVELRAFNVENPIYGPLPISLLVKDESAKRKTKELVCRYMKSEPPSESFFSLREGLLVATPELTFLRMARFVSEVQLAEVGMNLCGRYYIDPRTDRIEDRSRFLTTPEKLGAYVRVAESARGSKKSLASLRWVLPNSGSPYETKMKLLFCLPHHRGGFGLPFHCMNYDVKTRRLQSMMAQSKYSLDLVDCDRRTALEYDGEDSHQDASDDKRRRNELAVLGWQVFPIDKQVFHDPDATVRTGEQLARHMRIRLRRPPTWYKRYLQLRRELHLPT